MEGTDGAMDLGGESLFRGRPNHDALVSCPASAERRFASGINRPECQTRVQCLSWTICHDWRGRRHRRDEQQFSKAARSKPGQRSVRIQSFIRMRLFTMEQRLVAGASSTPGSSLGRTDTGSQRMKENITKSRRSGLSGSTMSRLALRPRLIVLFLARVR